MWKTVVYTPEQRRRHYEREIRSLRAQFARCRHSSYRHFGLQALREAWALIGQHRRCEDKLEEAIETLRRAWRVDDEEIAVQTLVGAQIRA